MACRRSDDHFMARVTFTNTRAGEGPSPNYRAALSVDSGCRSGKHALERRAIRRLAVRGQHELDRQVEQRTEPSDDIVARHVLATAELDVQSIAEIGERVAGDDRVDRR